MSLTCPSCGIQDFDPDKQCVCGYYAGEDCNTDSMMMDSKKDDKKGKKEKVQKNIDNAKNKNPAEEIPIKEVDSWIFTFSREDNSINLGTPALKEFKLKLTLEDLEELLEAVYRFMDSQKTIRKLQIPAEALADLIEEINRLIEEKRSKVSIKFEKGELQAIAELINKKLNE
jgi:hypothetical protein